MDKIGALGHTYKAGKVVENSYVEPTCQAPGRYSWVIGCWECDYADVKVITPESESNPAGYNLAQLNHVFTNYVYNNDATCYADGTKTAECDRCVEFFLTPVEHKLPAEGTQRQHLEPTTIACGEYWECQYENCEYVCPDALEHQMVPATCIAYAYCDRKTNGCTYKDVEAGYAACVPGEV